MRLGVNVDHVATVRQARLGRAPSPLEAARACVRAGADSIVCHLREDRRHIQDEDVAALIRHAGAPVNLEMSIAPDVVAVALRLKPRQVTLVPERRRELTTEGGLDVAGMRPTLARVIRRFHARGVGVSLFVDPALKHVEAAAAAGARIIELHTGGYANAAGAASRHRELRLLQRAATQAAQLGLEVAAGHGLDYDNTRPIARIREIEEVNIGFAIIARALFTGIGPAVREMKALLRR